MSATKSRKRRAAPEDLLDPSPQASPQAEKACLAGLLDILDRDAAGGREILADLTADMWTIDCGLEVFNALSDEYSSTTPTISGLAQAVRRRADDVGGDPADTMRLIADLAGNQTATGIFAKSNAARAAAEVREMYLRRKAILAAGDVLRQAHDRSLAPEEIRHAAGNLARVADVVEKRQNGGRRLRVRKASEIEPKPIEWFWPQRFSCGALTIITGMPGLSKSLLTIDIAARITTGGKWPDGTGSAPQGGVIFFGTEDDPDSVVVPRLMAAGANLELVRMVDGAEDGRSDLASPVSIERDLTLLREQLDSFPECKAIVFDPLSQYVESEENSNAQTRAALAPLVKLAQDRNVAILAVMHVSKKTDASMIHRIAGASSYGQMARHILVVGGDPDDPTIGKGKRRAMIVGKSSYGGEHTGQLYNVISTQRDYPTIHWCEGTVEMDAERLTPRPAGVNREQQDRRGEAVDALRDLLAGGERPSAEIEQDMKASGHGRRQIDHAVDVLGVRKRQTRTEDGRKVWMWQLPAAEAAGPGVGTYTADEWANAV